MEELSLSAEVFTNKIKEEHIFKKSNFMEKVILFNKSIFQYCKKYHNINIYLHPFKFLYYLKLKRAIKNKEFQNYIKSYRFENQGWIPSSFIPKDKNNKCIEVYTYVGNQKIIKLHGYGYSNVEKDDGSVFGWLCWIKRWRFIDDLDSNEIEEIKFFKKKNKKEKYEQINFRSFKRR